MRALIALAVVATIAGSNLAHAQSPSTIVQNADESLQSGNVAVFGSALRQLIQQQTGGTNIYQPLVQLGPITEIVVNGTQQVPNGFIVQARAFHQLGYADWTLGFSNLSQKIEVGNFNAIPMMLPDHPVPTPTDMGPPTTPPVPVNTDDACRKYPTLC